MDTLKTNINIGQYNRSCKNTYTNKGGGYIRGGYIKGWLYKGAVAHEGFKNSFDFGTFVYFEVCLQP